MLTDQEYELLTGFVDGELSSRQRKAALRLLRRSTEARCFLRILQTDSQLLQALPRQRVQPDFALRLLRTLADTPSPRAEPATPAASAAAVVPSWAGFVMAAALFLAVTLGSYLFFSGSQPNHSPGPLVQRGGEQKPPPAPSEPPGVKIAFADLNTPKTRKLLQTEINKHNALQLRLAAQSGAKTVEQLQNAFKDNGIELVVDPHAQMKINTRQKTKYVVYVENVDPYELTSVLQYLAAGPKNLDHLVLNPLGDNQRTQVGQLLGLKPNSLPPPPRVTAPAGGSDPMAALTKPRSQPRKGKVPSRPTTPEPPRLAMVFAVEDAGTLTPSHSSEAMRFLEARIALRPGTLQLVFVVEEALG